MNNLFIYIQVYLIIYVMYLHIYVLSAQLKPFRRHLGQVPSPKSGRKVVVFSTPKKKGDRSHRDHRDIGPMSKVPVNCRLYILDNGPTWA